MRVRQDRRQEFRGVHSIEESIDLSSKNGLDDLVSSRVMLYYLACIVDIVVIDHIRLAVFLDI